MPHDEEESGIYRNATGPISLEFEGKRIADDYKGELFNDYGFVVRAKAETGEDIHLWSFIYQQQGPEIVSCWQYPSVNGAGLASPRPTSLLALYGCARPHHSLRFSMRECF